MSTAERDWPGPSGGRTAGGRRITPLYKRLPKGPHGIAPEDVIHHQRIRMHGAMIEAVAGHGYERTSVKHVIGLAGVSRRAFYEQFANKEDCFMETFDLIVNRAIRRINGACRASDGPLEKSMRAGLRALVEELETNPKALHLVLIDALMAGPDGQLRLRRALAASEQLLASGFSSSAGEHPLPSPLVRAIVGGMRRALFTRLRDGRLESRSVLSGEMLRWTLLFASPALHALEPRPASRPPLPKLVQLPPAHASAERGLAQHGPAGHELDRQGIAQQGIAQRGTDQRGTDQRGTDQRRTDQHGTDQQGIGQHGIDQQGIVQRGIDQQVAAQHGIASDGGRQRLLESIINLTLREPYEEISAPHIAEEAGLSIDVFLELFESTNECFLAALDLLGGDLLEVVAHPDLVSPQWPTAVCQAMDRLTSYLVANPASTVTLATKTTEAGMSAIAETVTLSDEVTTLLTEGAPRRGAKLAPEWISGALAHTLHTEVLAGRGHLLDGLTEYMSYVVLAPYLGPEQAVQAVLKARPPALETLTTVATAAALPAAATEAQLGEMGEHDAHQQRDHDDDDQRSFA